ARIVLLAGLAEVIGGTIAMGLGAFLAVKSEQEFILSEREREEREVREFPDEERKEVRTIFARKGFRGQALDQMVQHVTADPVFWVDTMMTEELGLSAAPTGAPLRSGLVVATAYALGAAFPVIPYALPFAVPTAFAVSVGCTLAALFAAGAAKTRMTGRSWLRSGLETVLDGIGARGERTQQRGELKRRAHAEAERLVALGRESAQAASAAALVAAHASLLRLVGLSSAAPLLLLPEDPAAGAPPVPRAA